ncbi:MAG TPA: copper-binding protein, partial [Candidatus Nitrosotalea sp.]|nr:copper-binding protein [Candidatus Nitrosotalea sp.]
MSTRFKGFALLAILVCTIGVAPVFASPALLNYTGANQTATSGNTGEITVTTDKTSYNDGDKVMISGSTQDYISDTPITVIITSPIGNIVKIDQVNLGSDRTFSTSTIATGTLWQAAGAYTVKVEFGSQDRTAQTTFQFAGSSVGTGGSGNTIPVDGTNLSVKYSITNGKVLGIKADLQSKSLIVSIQSTGDGVLTVTLPRALINATLNGQDDKYIVLVDGQEADFQETSTTTTDRTLSIPFTDGTQEIEIIGTQI